MSLTLQSLQVVNQPSILTRLAAFASLTPTLELVATGTASKRSKSALTFAGISQVNKSRLTIMNSKFMSFPGRVAEVSFEGDVSGAVILSQADESSNLILSGYLTGLTPGKHGFHIHQNGNLSENCLAAGGKSLYA